MRGVNDWGYRPALDGLRTVAVYLVVLFHADLVSFEGGFIGVDLFFLLSGFLVTNVLVSDFVDHGTVRLGRFYARRARRLIPAATVAIVGTSAAMVLVASPIDRLAVVADGRAASLWYANWHFLFESQSYFAADDAPSPFLHFWSLSIEEQFYLLFPLLLLLVWWRRKDVAVVPSLLVGIAVVGVLVQVAVASSDPSQAYFGTHARIYQLAAGAAGGAWLRIRGVPTWLQRAGRTLAPVALAALVLAATPMLNLAPSGRGLVATACGTVLLMSLEGSRGGWLERILSTGPLVHLGRISYGTYLWHWPVLVLAGHVLAFGPLPAAALSAVLGTALASLSHELVEQPIRTDASFDVRRVAVIAVGVISAAATGLVVAPGLLSTTQRPVVVAAHRDVTLPADLRLGEVPPDLDFEAIRTNRAMGPGCATGSATECVVVAGEGLKVHLTGDSHAGMMLPALEALARTNGWQLTATTVSSCPWQPHLFAGEPGDAQSRRCREVRQAFHGRIIPEIAPDVIVAMGHPRARDYGKPVHTDAPELQGASRAELVTALTEPGVHALAALAPRVAIIETIPRAHDDMLACLSAAQQQSDCVFRFRSPDAVVDDLEIRQAVSERPSVASIDIDSLVCPDLPVCVPVMDGVPVRRDGHHLSVDYARALAPELARLFTESGLFPESVVAPDGAAESEAPTAGAGVRGTPPRQKPS